MKNNTPHTTITEMVNNLTESNYSDATRIPASDLEKLLREDRLDISPEIATAILSLPNPSKISATTLGKALTNASNELFIHNGVASIILDYAQENNIDIPVKDLAKALINASVKDIEKILAQPNAKDIPADDLTSSLTTRMPVLRDHDGGEITSLILDHAQKHNIEIPRSFLKDAFDILTARSYSNSDNLTTISKIVEFTTQQSSQAPSESYFTETLTKKAAAYIKKHQPMNTANSHETIAELPQHPNGANMVVPPSLADEFLATSSLPERRAILSSPNAEHIPGADLARMLLGANADELQRMSELKNAKEVPVDALEKCLLLTNAAETEALFNFPNKNFIRTTTLEAVLPHADADKTAVLLTHNKAKYLDKEVLLNNQYDNAKKTVIEQYLNRSLAKPTEKVQGGSTQDIGREAELVQVNSR